MLPPEPYTYRCSSCGWRRTLAPASDALMPADLVSVCPVCQSSALQREQATALAGAVARLRRRLRL
ncbi:MAG: hypothetical protein CL549_04160 [Alcanivorax sp.]|nr:hypothetical protein [Alcanivorax sp.]MAY09676.1 hypothetical protein [Alcanivorax sp.]MBI55222.1 hypothetical protein [Alcanivorax sp.]